MLKTKVKASAITNLTDARYFSAWEVAYIGFNLEQEGPKFVAELGAFPDLATTKESLDYIGVDAIQVATFCPLETITAIKEWGLPIIKEIVWNSESTWENIHDTYTTLKDIVDVFLLDFSTDKGGFEWTKASKELKTLCEKHPTLIDTALSESDIDIFLEQIQPMGIAVKGGEEEKVGYKSFDEVDGIFEAMEIFV